MDAEQQVQKPFATSNGSKLSVNGQRLRLSERSQNGQFRHGANLLHVMRSSQKQRGLRRRQQQKRVAEFDSPQYNEGAGDFHYRNSADCVVDSNKNELRSLAARNTMKVLAADIAGQRSRRATSAQPFLRLHSRSRIYWNRPDIIFKSFNHCSSKCNEKTFPIAAKTISKLWTQRWPQQVWTQRWPQKVWTQRWPQKIWTQRWPQKVWTHRGLHMPDAKNKFHVPS